MTPLVEALPGLLLVLGVPGILVLILARVRMTFVEAAAVVPIASIGAVWIVAEICVVLGIPFGRPAFAVLVAALLVLLVVSVARKRFRAPDLVLDLPPATEVRPSEALDREQNGASTSEHGSPRAGPARLRLLIAFGLLAVSVLIGGSTFLRGGMAGGSLTPPSSDASVHGYMIQRILRAESIEPREVLVTDPRGRSVSGQYYPLAITRRSPKPRASRARARPPCSLESCCSSPRWYCHSVSSP